MVYYQQSALDATFAALSDPTRRGILARLAQGETSVSELAAPYDVSLPAVCKHLRVLERARLIERRKDGRVHRCRLNADPMRNAAEWIEHYSQFWEEQLEALARYLQEAQKKETKSWQQLNRAPKHRSSSGERSKHRAKKSSRPGRTPRS